MSYFFRLFGKLKAGELNFTDDQSEAVLFLNLSAGLALTPKSITVQSYGNN